MTQRKFPIVFQVIILILSGLVIASNSMNSRVLYVFGHTDLLHVRNLHAKFGKQDLRTEDPTEAPEY